MEMTSVETIQTEGIAVNKKDSRWDYRPYLLFTNEHLYSPVAEIHYTSKVRPTHKQAKIQ